MSNFVFEEQRWQFENVKVMNIFNYDFIDEVQFLIVVNSMIVEFNNSFDCVIMIF